MLVGDMEGIPFADGHVLETVEQRGSHRRASGPAPRVDVGWRHIRSRRLRLSDWRMGVGDGSESQCRPAGAGNEQGGLPGKIARR